LSFALALGMGLGRRAAAAPPIKLLILQPSEGDVTGSDAQVRVSAEGGNISQTVTFQVTVDDDPIDPQTGRVATALFEPFTVPASAERRFFLHGLRPGVHILKVLPSDPAQASGASVAFSVGPDVASKGPNWVGIAIAAALVLLLLLYRRRVLQPRMARLERESQTEGEEEPNRPTWGEDQDDWPEGLPPKWDERHDDDTS